MDDTNDRRRGDEQARGQLTRERLLQSGAQEIARCGYERASLARVCSEAGVTTGALYAHFHSKSELAGEIIENQRAKVEAVARCVRDLLPGDFDRLLCFSADFAELVSSDMDVRASMRMCAERSLDQLDPWHHWASLADDLAATADHGGSVNSSVPTFGSVSVAMLIGAWLLTRDEGGARFDELLAEMWTAFASGAVRSDAQASARASVVTLFGR